MLIFSGGIHLLSFSPCLDPPPPLLSFSGPAWSCSSYTLVRREVTLWRMHLSCFGSRRGAGGGIWGSGGIRGAGGGSWLAASAATGLFAFFAEICRTKTRPLL